MKRILYTLPAVMVLIFYIMLGLLAGGFASFQPVAWLIMGAPVFSAVLLLAGRWWGSLPGMLMGGLLISLGMASSTTLLLGLGVGAFAYYMVMGILCMKDARKEA